MSRLSKERKTNRLKKMFSRITALNTKREVMNDLNTIKNVEQKQILKIIDNTNRIKTSHPTSIKATLKESILTVRWKTLLSLIQRIELMMQNGVKDLIIPSSNSCIKMKRDTSKKQ